MSTDRTRFDVIVIGSGMAGASAACEIAAERRVLLLERESQPGYHSTGRSAALFIKAYGNAPVRALTVASEAFYLEPPDGFSETPLLSDRGDLFMAREDQLPELEAALTAVRQQVPEVERLDATQIRELLPSLRPGYAAAGILDADGRDMDVHAILTGYLRLLRRRGGELRTDQEVRSIARSGGDWTVTTSSGSWTAPVVVNAAGAWGDVVAKLAGVTPLGLQPKRRTAFLVPPPADAVISRWPAVSDIGEQFYFKPDAGRLLCSPADETDTEPCDAWAEDIDVATAVERIEAALAIEVTRVERSWAGLRTFAPDRTPVNGWAPDAPGFYWLVGQGGYGIQTAPAMARIAAARVAGARPHDVPIAAGLDASAVDPARLLVG